MIEEVKMFAAHCDNCKEGYVAFGESSAMGSKDELKQALFDDDWLTDDDIIHYCPDCAQRGNNGFITVDNKRFVKD